MVPNSTLTLAITRNFFGNFTPHNPATASVTITGNATIPINILGMLKNTCDCHDCITVEQLSTRLKLHESTASGVCKRCIFSTDNTNAAASAASDANNKTQYTPLVGASDFLNILNIITHLANSW